MARRNPASPCVLGGARPIPPRLDRCAALLPSAGADAGIVGASLVIVRDGNTEAEEYVGYQDEAGRRPVDRETIYHGASITETFTGLAMMQLRDRGLRAGSPGSPVTRTMR